MRLFESALSFAIPSLGIGVRWLKEELLARGVTVRLTDASVRELAMGEFFDKEISAEAPAGSLLIYKTDVLHRGSDFGGPGRSRFVESSGSSRPPRKWSWLASRTSPLASVTRTWPVNWRG